MSVSKPYEPLLLSRPSAVPPTEVTHGSESGQLACAREVSGWQLTPVAAASGLLSPQSPAEKPMPMPSTAACLKTCSYAAISDALTSASSVVCMISPHELETTSARWLSTMVVIALNRSVSSQELAPT